MPLSPTIKGINTIKWGTDGALVNGNPGSTAILESAKFDPNIKEFAIEDNNGFDVSDVMLKDGFDATFNCLYDSAKTWPTEGDSIGVKLTHLATTYVGWVTK